jgi:hypothetical protein
MFDRRRVNHSRVVCWNGATAIACTENRIATADCRARHSADASGARDLASPHLLAIVATTRTPTQYDGRFRKTLKHRDGSEPHAFAVGSCALPRHRLLMSLRTSGRSTPRRSIPRPIVASRPGFGAERLQQVQSL